MTDFPAPDETPAPAALEALSEEAWRNLRELAAIAERCAPVFEETARTLRGFLACLSAVEKLRTSSAEVQATAAMTLFAALREASSIGSLSSAAEMLSKLSLAIAQEVGPES